VPAEVPRPTLYAALDKVPVAVVITDAGGTVAFWNAAAGALFGYTPQEAVAQRLQPLVRPSLQQSGAGEASHDTGHGERAVRSQWVTRSRDGRRFLVTASTSPLPDRHGRPGYTLTVLTEAGERDVPPPSAHQVGDVAGTPHAHLSRHESLFSALSRRSSDVAVVTDAEVNILYTSTSATDIFGYEPEDTVGMSGWSLVHPDDHDGLRAAVARIVDDPDRIERVTIRIRNKRGQWRWVEDTITNFLSEPGIGGLVANLRDVTDQVRAQEQLRTSEASYRAIAETAQEGIGVLSPAGKTLFANQKLADILGLTLAQTYSTPILTVLEAGPALELEGYLRDRSAHGPMTYEYPYRHPDGSELILAISTVPLPLADTGQVGSLAMVSDVTAERRAEQELRRRALHDALTDLPNRALLGDRLHMALARHERSAAGAVALMFLDLDQFKAVNDSLGHDAGDLLLIEIGTRLQRVVRAGDTVARLGGDEFAVLCENIDEPAAVLLAERLRAAVVRAIEVNGHRLFVDASIGIAFSPPQHPSTLLRAADAAMYQAKAEGRGRVRIFDSTLASSADRRFMVMSRLRESLSTGAGLNLHYQPVVDLATGVVIGAEALLRWKDEQLGNVSPLEVVAAVEATGLTFALDEWVLRKACADLASLRAAGVPTDLRLSVNLSAQNIGTTPLDELVAELDVSSGWPARQLTLEVTESALMTDPESAAKLLRILRERGVRVAVDDFGTGYSSLAYLQRLPVSVLKIDQSFVDSVTTDSDSLAIARSIVDLARGLGLRTVAEGIETPEQAAVMRELGCTGGQGYLWSPAIPLEALAEFVSRA
jgi:diguanylate cyclase (GGDEF)-like protein/PAS domain S-box-containing protein